MKILVIEDEARILSFLARGLEAEGYRVEGASDGRDGLARAVQGEWDLVLLDLMLPGLNGLDVLDALHRSRPDLPVLILSARADLPTKLRGFDLGASDYVSKPVALDELLTRVRVQLRRSRPGDDATSLRGGRRVLDPLTGSDRRCLATTLSRDLYPTGSSGCCTTWSCMRAR